MLPDSDKTSIVSTSSQLSNATASSLALCCLLPATSTITTETNVVFNFINPVCGCNQCACPKASAVGPSKDLFVPFPPVSLYLEAWFCIAYYESHTEASYHASDSVQSEIWY